MCFPSITNEVQAVSFKLKFWHCLTHKIRYIQSSRIYKHTYMYEYTLLGQSCHILPGDLPLYEYKSCSDLSNTHCLHYIKLIRLGLSLASIPTPPPFPQPTMAISWRLTLALAKASYPLLLLFLLYCCCQCVVCFSWPQRSWHSEKARGEWRRRGRNCQTFGTVTI